MAKDKGKEVSVKKAEAATKKEATVTPTRALSPLRSWEREIEHMFEDFPFFRWPPFRFARELRLRAPTLDVYEEKDDVVVKAELPGLTKDDIEISVTDSTLTLKGEKKREEEVKEKDFYRCEREYGSFLRTIDLPAEVKMDSATATFKDGVLKIRLPKAEEAKRKFVKIDVPS